MENKSMELLLNGYLTKDCDGHPSLTKYPSQYWAESIPRIIQNWKLSRDAAGKIADEILK